jgi:transposase
MEALVSKDKIERWIVPHLSRGKRGNEVGPPLWRIVWAILYRLKTGCQWRHLPLKEFFEENKLSWQGVYYHFARWTKDGSFERMWTGLLRANHQYLDLSCVQLDGSHTPAKNGGTAVGYQGRKAAKTTNMLFLSDNQGIMLACSEPQAGQHNDVYELQSLFAQLFNTLERAEIPAEGLFLNADAGFDCKTLRAACEQRDIQANIAGNKRNKQQTRDDDAYFDEELYKRRTVIERANAWIDSFKALLVRFETSTPTWVALHLLAFSIIFLRKINN